MAGVDLPTSAGPTRITPPPETQRPGGGGGCELHSQPAAPQCRGDEVRACSRICGLAVRKRKASWRKGHISEESLVRDPTRLDRLVDEVRSSRPIARWHVETRSKRHPHLNVRSGSFHPFDFAKACRQPLERIAARSGERTPGNTKQRLLLRSSERLLIGASTVAIRVIPLTTAIVARRSIQQPASRPTM